MDIHFAHRAAHQAIVRAKRVLLVSHPTPDGDTLAAASAMHTFCMKRKIEVNFYCKDVLPGQYAFMSGTAALASDPTVFHRVSHDVLAVFDAGDLHFAGIDALIPQMPMRPFIINFDHHNTNERFGDINVLDVKASSTAEVVHDFFRVNGESISRETAASLLTGILFDTGNFSNGGTTQSSFGSAGELLRRGAKIHDISNRLTRNKPLPALRLWGQALSRLKYNPEQDFAATAVFLSDLAVEDTDPEHTEGISNFLNTFLDVKIILVLKELPGGLVKGSLRTTTDTDMSQIAKLFGGGGHKKAAGFTVVGKIVETEKGWRVE